jgi:hypothetical protein
VGGGEDGAERRRTPEAPRAEQRGLSLARELYHAQAPARSEPSGCWMRVGPHTPGGGGMIVVPMSSPSSLRRLRRRCHYGPQGSARQHACGVRLTPELFHISSSMSPNVERISASADVPFFGAQTGRSPGAGVFFPGRRGGADYFRLEGGCAFDSRQGSCIEIRERNVLFSAATMTAVSGCPDEPACRETSFGRGPIGGRRGNPRRSA